LQISKVQSCGGAGWSNFAKQLEIFSGGFFLLE
jgi:hypothetical protein